MTTLRYTGNKKSISIGVGEFSGQFKPGVTVEVDSRFAEYLLSTGDFEVATAASTKPAAISPATKPAAEPKIASGDQSQVNKSEGDK